MENDRIVDILVDHLCKEVYQLDKYMAPYDYKKLFSEINERFEKQKISYDVEQMKKFITYIVVRNDIITPNIIVENLNKIDNIDIDNKILEKPKRKQKRKVRINKRKNRFYKR